MRMIRSCVWGLAVLLVLFGSHGSGATGAEERTLVGEVAVNESDEDGNVLSVYLMDTEEGDVLVAQDGVWKDLLSRIGDTIQVWGTLGASQDPDFEYVIHVTKFSPVTEEEAPSTSPEEEEEEEEEEDDGESLARE